MDPQRLLPQSVEDRLLSWLSRASGVLLLAGAALVWASLVSWSVNDPSLTHATTGEPLNWLGPIGAILSDLLLQTLGFATVVALIAPLLWGVELWQQDQVRSLPNRTKLGYLPLAVLAIAGALSSLPVAQAWPLHHGYGGVVGDGVFRLCNNLLAIVSSTRGGLVAGIVLWALSVAFGARSLGIDLEHVMRALASLLRDLRRARTETRDRLNVGLERDVVADDRSWTISSLDDTPPRAPLQSVADWTANVPNLGDLRPTTVLRDDPASTHGDADFHPAGVPPRRSYANPLTPATSSSSASAIDDEGWSPAAANVDLIADRGGSFDQFTDEASRAIAVRFAPNSSDVPAAQIKSGDVNAIKKVAQKASTLMGAPVRRAVESDWKRPSLNLLKRPTTAKAGPEFTQTVMRGNARLLEDVLADFGVKGEVKEIRPGPVVTLYELEPARGTKSSRVIGLADDMARSMSVASVRAAVVPGRNAIGLELPNLRREPVLLREILESDVYKTSDAALPIALGKGIGGEPIVADLARMPHLLVAGTTGSGKSVGVNAFILSLLYRHAPEDCRLLMIDPKMLELSVYNGIPHLLTPVVTDPHKAVTALNWAVSEMEERYKRMASLSVRNIDVFNNRVRNAKKRGELLSRTVQTGFDHKGQAIFENQKMDLEPLPHIVIVVDEFADLMIVAGKDVESAVQRLAQMARAAGIHLIMATQRPSVDIITGTIKANFPTRISFKVTSKIDSRTILNEPGAEQLLGQGDMLYSTGAGQVIRVHGPYVADEEVEAIADALRRQGPPVYVEGILDAPQVDVVNNGDGEQSDDDLYDRAVAIVLRDRKASMSYVQRRLSIGYNRAANLIERMEREGVISAANNVGKRDILFTNGGSSDED